MLSAVKCCQISNVKGYIYLPLHAQVQLKAGLESNFKCTITPNALPSVMPGLISGHEVINCVTNTCIDGGVLYMEFSYPDLEVRPRLGLARP